MNEESTQALEGAAAESAVESSSPAIDSDVASDSEAAPSPAVDEVEVATDEPEAVKEEPELPEFDFSAWDGGIDSLPENYHPVFNRLTEINTDRFTSIESELDQMRRLNDALMVGEEDPRINEYLSKYESVVAEKDQLAKDFQDFREEIERQEAADAEQYADRFAEQHKEIFEDPEKSEALAILIENGWEPEAGVKVLDLDEESMILALEAKRDGVPDKYAIRLAENAVRPKPKANPRPAAKITSGATTRSSPEQQMMDINETSSLDDKRMIVARRALKNARR